MRLLRTFRIVLGGAAAGVALAAEPTKPTIFVSTSTTWAQPVPKKAKALQALCDQWNARMQPARWEDRRWNGDENRKVEKREKKKDKKKAKP